MADAVEEAGEDVEWLIESILARGALTDVSGAAKRGGKTTFMSHAIAASAREEAIAGFATTPAKYLYLTEQGNNITLALEESGLTKLPDCIRLVQYKDVSNQKWAELMTNAAHDCKALGMDALIVDTFARFAKLRGAEENESGPVGERMRALQLIAQQYNIGAAIIRHDGKDGTPRGSSAFEAEVDICVNISRLPGKHSHTVRKLTGIGRYGEWERNIELKDARYISLGTEDNIAFRKAVRFINSVLPETPDAGMTKKKMLDLRAGDDEEITVATFDRALVWLEEKKAVGSKQLQHTRGKPKVYWKAAAVAEEFII